METRIDAVVIGAGQGGLATSWHLAARDIEHVVLERDRIAESWRSRRWDSFTLVTPGWTLRLPGYAYQGDPDRFLGRDEVVRYLEDYASSFAAPVRQGVRVDAVRPRVGDRLEVETERGRYLADAVVVATGAFQRPRVPSAADRLDPSIFQVHASAYRRPEALPEGAVLVVGGGQSAVQIADELREAGRRVYLSTGRSLRVPRRYRGHDLFTWGEKLGMLDRTVDQLEDPAERFAPNPTTTGTAGGRTLGLHHLARDGVTLLGRVEEVERAAMRFGSNLRATLEQADAAAAQMREGIDEFIEAQGMDAPPAAADDDPSLTAGFAADDVRELDLHEAGVHSVVWASGFSFDFSWVEGPAYEGNGYPVTARGVTDQPGVYFVGLHWLHSLKSGLFYGVGDDAAHVADAVVQRVRA